MAGQLTIHAGGVRRTRDQLKGLHTPMPTDTWTPVPHWDLVQSLTEGLGEHGITIAREQYATSGRDDARLFGVLDLRIPGLEVPDYAMAIGLRGSNDKSLAIQAVAGARVFVCDNMAFSGDSGTVILRKKHTSRLDLTEVVPPAIDSYLEKANMFKLDIEGMKSYDLSPDRAKAIILDALLKRVVPRKLLNPIADLYLTDVVQDAKFPERNLWSLDNAFTEAVKVLKPAPKCEAEIRIGRYFGRVLRQGTRSGIIVPRVLEPPVPAPAALEPPAVVPAVPEVPAIPAVEVPFEPGEHDWDLVPGFGGDEPDWGFRVY